MTDSPRWCATCGAYGLHHTDHHDLFNQTLGHLEKNVRMSSPRRQRISVMARRLWRGLPLRDER